MAIDLVFGAKGQRHWSNIREGVGLIGSNGLKPMELAYADTLNVCQSITTILQAEDKDGITSYGLQPKQVDDALKV